MIDYASESDIQRFITHIFDRFGNVENKSSVTIREELTAQNIINALGYTPLSVATIFDDAGNLNDTD